MSQHGWRIGRKRHGASEQRHSKTEESQVGQKNGANALHHRFHATIFEGLHQKTDSPGSSKFLLPGFWN